jgi:hypothetical protein
VFSEHTVRATNPGITKNAGTLCWTINLIYMLRFLMFTLQTVAFWVMTSCILSREYRLFGSRVRNYFGYWGRFQPDKTTEIVPQPIYFQTWRWSHSNGLYCAESESQLAVWLAVTSVFRWHICSLASWLKAVTEFPHSPQEFKALRPVHHGNRVRGCVCFAACSGHQGRDDTSHQSLQETHPHWPIPQLQI